MHPRSSPHLRARASSMEASILPMRLSNNTPPVRSKGRQRASGLLSPVAYIVVALLLLCVPGLVLLWLPRSSGQNEPLVGRPQFVRSPLPRPPRVLDAGLPRECNAWTRQAGGDLDDLVVHISPEVYPVAGYGGGGRVITGLLSAASPTQVVVLPAYAFLFNASHAQLYGMPVFCGEYAAVRSGGVPVALWALTIHVTPTVQRTMLLLGTPNDADDVWSTMWDIADVGSIYTVHGDVTSIDQAIWFAGAVQTLLHTFVQPHHRVARQGRANTGCDAWDCVTVHAHGAVHAPVLWYITESTRAATRPTLLYTMHDYLNEFSWQFSVAALAQGAATFLAARAAEIHAATAIASAEQHAPRNASMEEPHAAALRVAGQRGRWPSARRVKVVHGSLLALSMSDVATTVSTGMLRGMLDGSITVPEVVAAALQRAQRRQSVAPVRNGVDAALDPFRQPSSHPYTDEYTCDAAGQPSGITPPLLASVQEILTRKLAAKRALVSAVYANAAIPRQLPFVVTFVGRLEHNKGVMSLPAIIRSTCKARAAAPHAAPLLFTVIGTIPETLRENAELVAARAELQELATNRAGNCTVALLSDAELLPVARLAADVALAPSQHEAFGLVVAEAVAHGAIPVASAVGGISDIITHEPHAFLQASQPCMVPDAACDPSIMQLRADAASRASSRTPPAWTGMLVPLLTRDAASIASATAAVLQRLLRMLDRMRADDRSALVQRVVASTPRWETVHATFHCLRLRAAQQRQRAGRGLVLANSSPGGSVVPDARWGPQLLPRFKQQRCQSRTHFYGWTPSVNGYESVTLSAASNVQVTAAHMQLPPASNVVASIFSGAWGAVESRPVYDFERRAGLVADLEFPSGIRAAVQISGYARASHLQPGQATAFCVYADAFYSDGGFLYGVAAPFAAGTHDWMMQTIEIAGSQGRKLTRVTVAFLLHVIGDVSVSTPSARMHFSL